ncbi:MAG: HAD family phosphatase [Clostridiales bacterium]|nr:HAD family phosphatase [Clostridiales bacterium]
MNERKYSLIVSDFDGTLFRSDHTIADETIQTIRDFVDKGGLFVLSSGRPLQSILKIARELGLKGLVSAFNGSVVADIETGELVLENVFSVEDSVRICRFMEENGMYVQIYEIDKFYASERIPYLEYYESILKDKAILPEKKMSDFILENKIEPIKILSMMHPKDRESYRDKIESNLSDICEVTSGAINLLEICVKGFTKGTALKFLAEKYGVDIQETLAIGDGWNDYSALATAGKGIAVKNAEPILKEKFEVSEYSNDENVVGRIIEKYGKVRCENEK